MAKEHAYGGLGATPRSGLVASSKMKARHLRTILYSTKGTLRLTILAKLEDAKEWCEHPYSEKVILLGDIYLVTTERGTSSHPFENFALALF
jgi:hypothetical protein